MPVLAIGACTQTTPSMMNESRIQVVEESIIDQIEYDQVDQAVITRMAQYYLKNATGPLDLTLTYNPKSKYFGRSKANNELSKLVSALRKKGVNSITTDVMPVPNASPLLIINYESATALAPADCGRTPGLNDYQTGRFIGDYKFGCGVETMFAKQIADPTDLYGNSQLGTRDARREANVVETYRTGQPSAPIEGVETNERIGN